MTNHSMDDNNISVREFNRTLLVHKSFYFGVCGARSVCNKKKVFISQASIAELFDSLNNN